jgi:hypothetical protein
MANKESLPGSGDRNVVELLALIGAGRINWADISPENQQIFSQYMELMDKDPILAAQVLARKNEILLAKSQKSPLFTKAELKKAKKHKPKIEEFASQSSIWPTPVIPNKTTPVDREANLMSFIKKSDNPRSFKRKNIINVEINKKTLALRNRIGLPIARGKDPHVNDDFYKFLVKQICEYDIFHIFNEYDRAVSGVSPDLDSKINQVKSLVSQLLANKQNESQKIHQFYQLTAE